MTTFYRFTHKICDSQYVLATFIYVAADQKFNTTYPGIIDTKAIIKHPRYGSIKLSNVEVKDIGITNIELAELLAAYKLYTLVDDKSGSVAKMIEIVITKLARRYLSHLEIKDPL